MPYGFSNYLREKEKSEQTVEYYDQIIQQFFSFVNKHYNSELEIHEIGTKHIYGFLNQKKEDCSNNTVNKIISILKHFFDYLWYRKLVPIDPMSKVKRQKEEELPVTFNYMNLLDVKDLVLNDSHFNLKEKVIFLLSIKGITVSELFFKKEDVFVISDNLIFINVIGKAAYQRRTIELVGNEATLFYFYYEQTLFLPTPFVFYRKRLVGEEDYDRIHHNQVNITLKKIRKLYPTLEGYTLTKARTAYIIYLYSKRHYTVEQLSYLFGTNKTNISKLIESNLLKTKNELVTNQTNVVE